VIDGLVCDEEPGDALLGGRGPVAVARADTLMDDDEGRRRVAVAALDLAASLRAGAQAPGAAAGGAGAEHCVH
jgi:hypothetical protein